MPTRRHLWIWCYCSRGLWSCDQKGQKSHNYSRLPLPLPLPQECSLLGTGQPSPLCPSFLPFASLRSEKARPSAARGGGCPTSCLGASSDSSGWGVFMSSRNGCKSGTSAHLWPGHPLLSQPLALNSFQWGLGTWKVVWDGGLVFELLKCATEMEGCLGEKNTGYNFFFLLSSDIFSSLRQLNGFTK